MVWTGWGFCPPLLLFLSISLTETISGGARRASPLHVCLVESNVLAEGGVRLLFLSIPRNPTGKADLHGGPRDPRLVDS